MRKASWFCAMVQRYYNNIRRTDEKKYAEHPLIEEVPGN